MCANAAVAASRDFPSTTSVILLRMFWCTRSTSSSLGSNSLTASATSEFHFSAALERIWRSLYHMSRGASSNSPMACALTPRSIARSHA